MSESVNKRFEPIPEVDGMILTEYQQGDYKLSMWIPDALGNK